MPKPVSAGLLMYRRVGDGVEVLIAHPGGPIWAKKDQGAWSLPKGLVEPGEDPLATAQREFTEETGFLVAPSEYIPLGSVQLKSGKVVHGWAFEGDANPADMVSNTFTMAWPPRSGLTAEFVEIDRVMWATPAVARDKLNPAQAAFVDRLVDRLEAPG